QGVFDISEVQFAVVETTGKISVYQNPNCMPVTAEQMEIQVVEENPPQTIIDDGDIIFHSLDFIGMSKDKLMTILNAHQLEAHDVFLMTSDGKTKTVIIKKTGEKENG
ncbi:MAG: DUF421 domain-containing protein, partial [Clostridiales bacterium]|nr:DUF421 domain-containing protein [Clostridiales bacterium]